MKKSRISLAAFLVTVFLFSSIPTVFASQSNTGSSNIIYNVSPPNVQVSNAPGPNVIPFCQTSIGTLLCYTPSFIRTAYNFPSTLDGSGQTIVIVDAFGSPTIQQDLATFDSTFNIPAPPSFTVVCDPSGCPSFTSSSSHGSNMAGWTLETSLDVEYAHAMAPGANIVLAVASTNYGNAINSAESKAIQQYPGSIMSQSFGSPEILLTANNAQLLQAEQNYQTALSEGITVLASAGDSGATNGYSTANAGFPASSPYVLAVGGTQGNPYGGSTCSNHGVCDTGLVTVKCSSTSCTPTGYGAEQVWNEPEFDAATGGAPSLIFGVPSFQQGLGLSSRTIPDVSYNAAVDGGVLVKDSYLSTAGFFIVGGTSAGSPQWAAIIALANQYSAEQGYGPLGFVNQAIYSLAQSSHYSKDFHDITVGNNTLVGTPVGFNAATGYDAASGWGTPNVANLVPDLVACAQTTSCP